MSSKILDFTNVFFGVYIKELMEAPLDYEGRVPVLMIKVGNFVFKVRRIRVIGKIIGKEEYSRWIDYKLHDGTGEVIVRLWQDARGISKSELTLDGFVTVFGFLKEFRGTRYISPFIVRKRHRVNFEEWFTQIERARAAILNSIRDF